MRARATNAVGGNLDYRGVAAPAVREASPMPVFNVPPPYAVSMARAATTPAELRGYSASQVLTGALRRWGPLDIDGASHPSRVTPAVDFAGIANVCGTLTLPTKLGAPHAPNTGMTLTPDGTVLLPLKENDHQINGVLVSAKMERDGRLRQLAVTPARALQQPPFLTSDQHLLMCGQSSLLVFAMKPDGTLEQTDANFDTGCVTALRDNLCVSDSSKGMRLVRVSRDGKLEQLGDDAPLPQSACVFDAAVTRKNLIITTNRDALVSYALDGTTLTLRSALTLFQNPGFLMPPVLVNNRLVVAARTGGYVHAASIDDHGSFGIEQQLDTGAGTSAGIVARGTSVVLVSTKGDVRSIRYNDNGSVEDVHSLSLGSAVTARPTLTRDGIVLIGAHDGVLYALALGDDGSLCERTHKDLGAPIRGAVTVTADGLVLVATDAKLFALRG